MIIKNIGRICGLGAFDRPLRGEAMNRVSTMDSAWLRTAGDRISSFGRMEEFPAGTQEEEIVDAGGAWLMPSFCDSHTHIVYAGSREGEFEDKINGLSYEEIARRGGGILNSADRLASTPEDELFRQSLGRLHEVAAMGTGCIEIKSGYGLSLDAELKMLRVSARLAEAVPMVVKSTFLGAHAVGRAYEGRQAEYVDHVCRDMLPAVAAEGLAEFVDVFCDRGFFTPEQTSQILEAAARYGLRPKIHANELDVSGGVQVGVSHNAVSVDHLERITGVEIGLLSGSDTVATLLPGASFFLGMPYGPAKDLIESGAAVALASDYNPGSSPSGSMRMVMSLGCIKMRLTPQQAFNAVTVNGAAAMDCLSDCGSIAPGKVANFFLVHPMDSLAFFPYAYTAPLIRTVFLAGRMFG